MSTLSSYRQRGVTLLLWFLVWSMGPNRLVWAQGLPTNFNNAKAQDGYTLPVGMVFSADHRQLFVWDKAGHIWVSAWNGTQYVRQATPVLDISEEVGNWGDAGMLSLCLDPHFEHTKRIYLFYVVDRHHLLYAGTPQYDPAKSENGASIGRLTRYELTTNGSELSANSASRYILIGESKSTGVPLTHDSHSGATVVFGTDGTLLLSTGDNASYIGTDAGSPSSGNWQQALNDGILRPNENVGSFRSQMITSLCGKILRLDPETGNGIASNPFYDGNVRSARSRVWALGFRNPFRMSVRPGTGSANPADGNPGTLIVNEVGWDQWEELTMVQQGGQNAGWPMFEGNDPHNGFMQIARTLENKDEPNPSNTCNKPFFTFFDLLKQAQNEASGPVSAINPCSSETLPGPQRRYFHNRPILEWQHGSEVARYPTFNGNTAIPKGIGTGGATVVGQQFGGYCSIAGAWYTGTRFPDEYRNMYYFADYASNWIKVARFGPNGLAEIKAFAPNGFGKGIVDLKYNALDQSLYYLNINSGEVMRISYGGNRPPVAALSADKLTGSSPLPVSFVGDKSSDPDGDALTYAWDFGDGTTSAVANPTHTFTATGQRGFTVQLTVTDAQGQTDRQQVTVSLGNKAPVAKITSPLNNAQYPIDRESHYTLTADVTDDDPTGLTYAWQLSLRHNTHEHREPVTNEVQPTIAIAPVGCDGETYYYFIKLIVTDRAGLTATDSIKIYPNCGAGNLAVANLKATPQSGAATVSWTNPTLAFDQVMVVAKEGSGFSDKPTGNAYTADANFAGTGSAQEGGKVVFKGTGTSVAVTGLTNGKTYYFRVYTMKGAAWTGGVETSAVPSAPTLAIDAASCYKLTGRASSQVLEIDNGSSADLAPARLRAYAGKNWQHWKLQATSDGYYRLIAQHAGKSLDVSGGSQDDQAAVVQWAVGSGNSNPNQEWKPVGVEGNYYRLLVRHSGKAMDVRGGSSEEGAAIVQLTPNANQSQQWLIESVGCETTTTPTTPTTPPAVSLREADNPANAVAGLDYQYYEGTWSTLPDFAAQSSVKTGTSTSPELTVRSRETNYGLRFTGYVNVPTDGTYTFYTTSDDGSKLYIGATEVVNNDGQHGDQERSGSIGLKAGKHALSVLFFQGSYGQTLSVSYSGPALSKQIIPASAFYRVATTTPTNPTPATPTPTPVADAIYLSDLNWTEVSNGYGPVEKDKSNGDAAAGDGRTLTLNGQTYAKGLGVHAGSSISYSLGGQYASFSTELGLDDEMSNPGCGSIEFSIYLDNVKVYSSGVMGVTTATKSVSLDVTGRQILRLVVSDGSDGVSCDHGDWANARLTKAGSGRVAASPETSQPAVVVYPNPARDVVQVRYWAETTEPLVVQLLNAMGQPVLHQTHNILIGENLISLPVSDVSRGFYLLSLTQGTQRITRKIVLSE